MGIQAAEWYDAVGGGEAVLAMEGLIGSELRPPMLRASEALESRLQHVLAAPE